MTASPSVFGFLSALRDAAVDEARDLLADGAGLRGMSMRGLDDLESRLDDASRAASRLDSLVISVGREPMTYREGGPHSFFMDQASLKLGSEGSEEARARIQRHTQEMAVESERRDALARREFSTATDRIGIRRERRDLTRVDGAGGNFAAPLWMLDEMGVFPRPGRVLADRVTSVPLPKGTDSVSVPRVTTGSAVAFQVADNSAVQETDLVVTDATSSVRTLAGQTDAAIQLVDQAPRPGFDRIVFDDLMADYDRLLESQLIAGSGAAGQLSGLLTSPGTTVTWTDATPTPAELVSKVGDLASQVSTARQLIPSHVFVHPRRGFWLQSQPDTTTATRPMNPVDLAAPERDPNANPIGSLLGMALVLAPAVPANLGGGVNEDRVIVTRAADHLLLEGEPMLSTHVDVLSGTLTVRFGFRRYVAFISQRVPSATGVLVGTGLAAPTFA